MDLPGIVGVACDVWRGEGGGDGITVCAIVEGGRKVFIVTMATLASCIQCLLKEQLLDQVTKVTPLPGPAPLSECDVIIAGVCSCEGDDSFAALPHSPLHLPPHHLPTFTGSTPPTFSHITGSTTRAEVSFGAAGSSL